MTTPRTEEILVEAKEIGKTDMSTEDVPKFLRVYKFTNEELTQIILKTHQAGKDEAVKEERNRIKIVCETLLSTLDFNGLTVNRREAGELGINKVKQALQDNK